MISDDIKKRIIEYLEGIPSCHNESQRKERFIALVGQIFPKHSKEIFKLTEGAEKFLKVTLSTGKADTGFIDTFYGNLVIEFEHKLPKMLSVAEEQLKEYVAKLWTSQKSKQPFLCIASDGVYWVIYTPILNRSALSKTQLSPNDVELVKNEPFEITKNNIEDFYYWIDRVFFRENSLPPTSQMICAEFGISSFAFTNSSQIIQNAFKRASEMKELKVAYDNWSQYLKYTYGNIEGSENLFVSHSYLSAFTKILMAHVLSARNKKSLSLDDIDDIVTGQYFLNLNIRNYVEKDFFYWVNFEGINKILKKIWVPIFHSLKTYDFSKIEMDFLKDIYQGLIDPEDRHDLGEYYTPDWLCEKIVKEALVNTKKDDLPRIGDITCGSGSFLRAAIKEIRTILKVKDSKSVSYNTDVIQKISKSVIGFEIHPLAVFIAKTNYMLALEDLLDNISQPFNIPIYLCDSLLNAEMDQGDLFQQNKFRIQFAGNTFILPITETLTDERFDELIDYIDRITHTYKKSEIDESKVGKLLDDFITGFKIKDKNAKDLIVESMKKLTMVLHQKVLNHENTIWSFILKNNYRPVFFAKSFDIIVGNPPWLSFRYVESKEYKTELERLGLKKYSIAPTNTKLRTQMELATIFLAHGVHCYLNVSSKIYFVLPRSIFSADNHSSLRENKYTFDMRIVELWDLFGLEPVFNVPSCVFVGENTTKPNKIEHIDGRVFSGKFPVQNISLSTAIKHFTEEPVKFYISKLNNRTAISLKKSQSLVCDSHYIDKFRTGGTLYPRNYFYVETNNDFRNKKVVHAKTSQEVIKNAKPPYKDIIMSGNVDTKFLFYSCLAENILPFMFLNSLIVHLPLIESNSEWKYLPTKEMLEKGYRNSSEWFQFVDKSYNKLNDGKKTVYERLNYHNDLLIQNPRSKYWVFYCAAGKHVCACVLENNDLFWADHMTYCYSPKTKSEAYYLAGILNSSSLDKIIKPFQSKGLLGERHVHKKILDIGIPQFTSDNKTMMEISELSFALSKEINKYAKELKDKAVGKKRSRIRETYSKEFSEIDKLVMKLFK